MSIVHEKVYNKVRKERQRQDDQWGGAPHDDIHDPQRWFVILLDHVARLAKQIDIDDWEKSEEAEEQLVKVAALAFAWLEAWERKP